MFSSHLLSIQVLYGRTGIYITVVVTRSIQRLACGGGCHFAMGTPETYQRDHEKTK